MRRSIARPGCLLPTLAAALLTGFGVWSAAAHAGHPATDAIASGGRAAAGPLVVWARIGSPWSGRAEGPSIVLAPGGLATAGPQPQPAPTDNPNPGATPTSASAPCLQSVQGEYTAAPIGGLRLYLPALFMAAAPAARGMAAGTALPDLITRYVLCPATAGRDWSLRVTVLNVGQAATPPQGFWVDAYLNSPAAPDRAVPWDAVCSEWPCYGLAWFVEASLAPGEMQTFSEADIRPEFSLWPPSGAAGARTLFVYADSYAEQGDPAGAVRETSEVNNRGDLPGGPFAIESTPNPGPVATRPPGRPRRQP